ncbi:ImmA/IrrE family metallo-endopeptidase [Zhihengliuella sp.]|uniref:ImmA/IrrE family metallo-endopeptidase n=1 Tax=Zhihengliuella sp. TaxID=1954483 RepID=UPI00281288F2|nr:ImmA/IrrE family metallo-endopeptidase [Zhihengliuella sp.]
MLVKEAAKLDAEQVLNTYWDGNFPVDVNGIAKKMGVEVFDSILASDISGYIVKRPGEPAEIHVATDHVPTRKRFTVAHELGHFVERTTRAGDDDFGYVEKRGGKRTLQEFYADEFAGHVLMPQKDVDKMGREGKKPFEMAKAFGVSLDAMMVRLRRLHADA